MSFRLGSQDVYYRAYDQSADYGQQNHKVGARRMGEHAREEEDVDELDDVPEYDGTHTACYAYHDCQKIEVGPFVTLRKSSDEARHVLTDCVLDINLYARVSPGETISGPRSGAKRT